MSLYDVLGIDDTADEAAIKRAHRQAAKAHHPDNGGDRDSFEKIQHAYLVLKDPERRSKYDKTGDDGIQTEQMEGHDLLQFISMIFDTVYQSVSIGQLGQLDMIASMVLTGKDLKKQMDLAYNDGSKELKKLKATRRRLSRKKEGSPLLIGIIDQKIRVTEVALEKVKIDMDRMDRAVEHIQEHKWEADAPGTAPKWAGATNNQDEDILDQIFENIVRASGRRSGGFTSF